MGARWGLPLLLLGPNSGGSWVEDLALGQTDVAWGQEGIFPLVTLVQTGGVSVPCNGGTTSTWDLVSIY